MRRAKVQQLYPAFYARRTFYGSQGFILMFTRFHHLSMCRARGILTVPAEHISWRYILILFSHPFICLAGDLYPSDFSTSTAYAFFFPHMFHMSSPSHPPWFDHVIIAGEYNSWNFSSCIFIQYPVISFSIGQNIFFSVLFSNTLSLCSWLTVRNTVSHLYKQQTKLPFCVFHSSCF
jgi:hypothetical protein